MATFRDLQHNLAESVRRFPQRPAVEDPAGATLTYAELDEATSRLRDHLRQLGLEPADRVAFCLPKSIDSIVCMYGALKAGVVYIPLDPEAPARRNALVVADSGAKLLVAHRDLGPALLDEVAALGAEPPAAVLVGEAPIETLHQWLVSQSPEEESVPVEKHVAGPQDPAYVLYTSGSTGKPKGVMLSQENATSFIDWCSATFEPTEVDRFSSHAPLHFDLSVLDVHVSLKHGATLVLIDEGTAKSPRELAPMIAEKEISIWYSAPSILCFLIAHGRLDRYDYSALRLILFAGEVFPVKHLRNLKLALPHCRYFNLYGPTETNVCTFFEIPESIPEARTEPYPIGKVCAHGEALVIDVDGNETPAGEEGELCIRGPLVTAGYWHLPEVNARAFHRDQDGNSWYKTGDLVFADGNDDFVFVGRRDRMVKKRGYRIELGEVETGVYRCPNVREAAVIAVSDEQRGVQIIAFLATNASDGKRPSIIALKTSCGEALPSYMIPDVFIIEDSLPRTSTGKVDYQQLTRSYTDRTQ